MTKQELGGEADFVIISGDAYVDHPAFAAALIGRVLENEGYSVGIIAQPDWHSADDFKRFGRPRLAFLIAPGNIDSMVNHYTCAKRRRSSDAYTEGGVIGKRPDRAAIVYSNRAREAYRGVPIILGGIEASLRRFAHYDYWDDKVRRSVLSDSGADLLVYGMGEKQIKEIAKRLSNGEKVNDIRDIHGTCYMTSDISEISQQKDSIVIDSYDDVALSKDKYSAAFMVQYTEQDPIRGKRIIQKQDRQYMVANPPAMPLSQKELDEVYELPYTRLAHSSYKQEIPALKEVKFSLTSCRGCFGACSFCALTFHQGRIVQTRSHESLIREAKELSKQKDFKGYIHDVGGPTANYRQTACKKQLEKGACKDRQCIGFKRCPSLNVSHSDYVSLLRKLRALPKIKKVFVRSGIRYDYAMYDRDDTFLRELVEHHVSGQLKVAPEHISNRVLELMNKPDTELFDKFVLKYNQLNAKYGKEQYIVPYFMSSHPGSDLNAAIQLAEYLKKTGMRVEQVQDFYPTPGTLSTCMYYTGRDPRTNEKVYVPKTQSEKDMQRALMQFYMPQYRNKAREALLKAGRDDLIGTGKNALVPPLLNKTAQKADRKGTQKSDKRSFDGRKQKANTNRMGKKSGKRR